MKSYAPFLLFLMTLLFSCTNKKQHPDDLSIFTQAVRKYKAAKKEDIKGNSPAFEVLRKEMQQADPVFSAYNLSLTADTLAGENDYTAAYRCYYLSADLANKHGLKTITGYSKLKMAKLELQVGDYHTAQQSAAEALTYFEAPEDIKYIIEGNNTIGMTYEFLQDYETALKYYSEANSLPNDTLNHIILQNNLAHIYTLQKRSDLALPLYRKLLSCDLLKTSPVDNALVKDNYGYALFLHNPNEGGAMLDESVALREEHQLLSDLPSSYLHLSEFYAEKDKAKALQFADRAFKAASAVGNPDEKLDALAAKISINKEMENGGIPFQYVQLSKKLNQARSSAKNAFAKLRLDKKEVELENANNERMILIITLVLFALAGGSAFYWYKTKKDRQLDEQRTMARFAKKLHDEVANDMFQAMSFAGHEDLSKDHIREILLDNLEDIYSKTRDISKNNSRIDTGESFPGELRGLINAFVGIHTKIVIAGVEQIDWNKASVAAKFTCYRIVQEWLVNMKKHSNASLVVLNFKKAGRFLEVSYTDNGVGSEKKTGSGLQNAENRTKQLKGTLKFETAPGKGFRATLQIPF